MCNLNKSHVSPERVIYRTSLLTYRTSLLQKSSCSSTSIWFSLSVTHVNAWCALSPIFNEKRRIFYQKSPIFNEKALYSITRALHFVQSALHCIKNPYIHHKRPVYTPTSPKFPQKSPTYTQRALHTLIGRVFVYRGLYTQRSNT